MTLRSLAELPDPTPGQVHRSVVLDTTAKVERRILGGERHPEYVCFDAAKGDHTLAAEVRARLPAGLIAFAHLGERPLVRGAAQ